MEDRSKYYGQYMDNESYCEGQKPFIHMHLDNIIRDIIPEYRLSSDIDYIIDFSDSAVTLIFTVDSGRSDDEVFEFIAAVKHRLVVLADERYPIRYMQTDSNRLHDFYINLSNFLDTAKINKIQNNDKQISVNCNF